MVGVIFAMAAGVINSAAPGEAELRVYDCYDSQKDGFWDENLDCRSQRLAGKSTCSVTLTLSRTLKQPIMLQYQLDEYYQNHRRYYDSVSYAQLHQHGSSTVEFSYGDVEEVCTPLVSPNNSNDERTYDPCGLKAASLFDDEVEIRRIENGEEFPLRTSKDITFDFEESCVTWNNRSGRGWLFGQSDSMGDSASGDVASGEAGDGPSAHVPSAGWLESFARNVSEGPTRADFAVWMRSSPHSMVRKPLLRIEEDLPAGEYALLVHNAYDVEWFRGCKSLRLSPLGRLGGESSALITALSLLCAMSFLLALAIGLSICFSAQPARVEALLHELLHLEKQEEHAARERKRSMLLPDRPQEAVMLSGIDDDSSRSEISARDSARGAPYTRQPTGAYTQLHSQQSRGGDSSRASQLLSPDRSSKRPSQAHAPAASAPHPGMRRLETEPAAIFDRHRAREREILARYAPHQGEG